MAYSLDPDTLRRGIASAAPRGMSTSTRDRARRLMLAWIDTAIAHRVGANDLARALRDGQAARQIAAARRAEIAADPPDAIRNAACAPGCAFCCVLTDEDGGTISTAEAQAVHAALVPMAGQRDGSDWMHRACPALDPETRLCRIYDDRPEICRSYISTDAAACEINAAGGSAPGGGVIGSHVDFLALLAVSRAAMTGLAQVPTFALRDVAAAALNGRDAKEALNAARHPPVMLDRVQSGAERGRTYSSGSSSSGEPTRTQRPPR
ncbi:YkgJ family cysteine cluster protein [Palleronia abyssalis]|uniref:YkgJ family cysteine cluster protein n=1 Tax=Palleronia abyssalis TaxID=1501240 RepID=A0A2R8BXZ7_9RHOB|nr:YkgJ family cysteine cluster protein [Palleronia abyssalis]SPJ25035.1 hypothetical protein PAA8504_02878 [Palleronia abyssalis]